MMGMQRCCPFMCGGVLYGEVDRLVSVERWSCSRGDLVAEVLHVW